MFENAQMIVTLPAADIGRARVWYLEKLGLQPVEDRGQEVWYEVGGSPVLLYQTQFAGTNQATAAGISVDDFGAAMTELKDRGVLFEDYDFGEDFRTVDGVFTLPDGSKVGWFKDSEGNILSLITRAS